MDEKTKKLLTDPRIWMLLFGLIVGVIAPYLPNFELDTAQGAGFAAIIAAYVLGVTRDPAPDGGNLLRSRKFIAACVGLVLLILDGFNVVIPADLTPDQIVTLVLLVTSAIAGFALDPKPDPVPEAESTQ